MSAVALFSALLLVTSGFARGQVDYKVRARPALNLLFFALAKLATGRTAERLTDRVFLGQSL
jgi:hypothetical protein